MFQRNIMKKKILKNQTLLDIEDYIKTRNKMIKYYEDREGWNKKVLINISKAGFFSSDRTIEQYNDDIWKLK